ncbi:hypothetical protein G3N90_02925 [Xanthomonas hortorum pv. gardneri]|uniref:hypothetical protein n=1 Tax=Xanthomonas hortorum TaxID=56454 RepID=UPI002FE0778F
MKIVPSVPGTRLPTYMFFHVAIMLCISLLVMALANWRAVNELIVSIITFGGKFWPPAIVAALAATFPLAKSLAEGDKEDPPCGVAFGSLALCLVGARGAWLVQPDFSGSELEWWAMVALVVLAFFSAVWAIMTLIMKRSEY